MSNINMENKHKKHKKYKILDKVTLNIKGHNTIIYIIEPNKDGLTLKQILRNKDTIVDLIQMKPFD